MASGLWWVLFFTTLRVGDFLRASATSELMRIQSRVFNIYDDFRESGVCGTVDFDEIHVEQCIDEFIISDLGKTMFGCHSLPQSVGITGSLAYVDLEGPTVVVTFDGQFWHRRSFVLGRLALWLNARMPEITEVIVRDIDELDDFNSIRNEV
jgi:hypothetical protein